MQTYLGEVDPKKILSGEQKADEGDTFVWGGDGSGMQCGFVAAAYRKDCKPDVQSGWKHFKVLFTGTHDLAVQAAQNYAN